MKCKDCNKTIGQRSISHKCRSCAVKGKNNPFWKPRVSRICNYCLQSKEIRPCKIKTFRYCSADCYHKSRIGKKRPEHSKAMMGKFIGRIISEETKQKMRNNHSDVSGKNNPMYGVHLCGDQNPNWCGGISQKGYPFEFNDQLKEKIRKRDNYTCQLCSITEEEHLIVFGKVLYVHHIDYNKENLEETNLISLCNTCNLRVNYNREYWQNHFENKVNKNGCAV